MKRILIMIMLLMFVALQSFAQYWPGHALKPATFTATTDSVTYEKVYVLFPALTRPTYIDTALANVNIQGAPEFVWKGEKCYLYIEPDSLSSAGGSTADSLSLWVKPLVWDYGSATYTEITKDSINLVFDTASKDTSVAKDILDWDDDTNYGCELTNYLRPTQGFVLYLWIENSVAVNVSITTLISQDYR